VVDPFRSDDAWLLIVLIEIGPYRRRRIASKRIHSMTENGLIAVAFWLLIPHSTREISAARRTFLLVCKMPSAADLS